MSSISRRDDEVREASRGIVQCAKGDTVFHQGDLAHQWFEVISGIVRTCRFMADGHRQLTGFYYSGDVFGVDGPHHREAAEAVTDVVLRRRQLRASAMARAKRLSRLKRRSKARAGPFSCSDIERPPTGSRRS